MKQGDRMDKILVKLYVPVIEKTYDVLIPAHRRIYNVIQLLMKAVNELNDGCYTPSKMPLLYDRVTAEAYDVRLSVKEANIKNGTDIILV